MKHLRHLSVLLALVLVQRASFCVGLNDDREDGVREVTIDNRDARVVGVIDRLSGEPQEEESPYEPVFGKDPAQVIEQHISRNAQIKATSCPFGGGELHASGWINFLKNKWLEKFLIPCNQGTVGATQNLSAMQAFVAFVSIGYAVVAMWLGPIKLSRWQRRSVLVTYSAAGAVQALFLAHAFSFVGIHYAYSLTLALVLLFFVAFNFTNALLVFEPEAAQDDIDAPVQQIVEASSTRIVTSLRAPCF